MDRPTPPQDRLALLYQLSQTFNSSLNLDEVLNRVIDEVIVATRAERGFVMLRDEDGKLSFRVARGLDQQTIQEPRFQISRSIVERVAAEGQPVLTSDAQVDDRFNMRESVLMLGLRAILCVPLIFKEKVLGAIYVDSRIQAGIFDQSDLELLSALANSAAIAIENARLYQLSFEQGRMERELHLARQVQAGLLPRSTPQLPGWEFVGRWQPVREVAGDYYDYIPLPGGGLGLVIADVTDKGMPAALFMTLTRSTVRASVAQARSPAAAIRQVNRLLTADANEGMFVTLFYAQLDPRSGELRCVNAGHNPPLVFHTRKPPSSPDEFTLIGRSGMALGIEMEAGYMEHTTRLDPGDFILLYTDGLTDAMNPEGKPFELEGLRAAVFAHRYSPAATIVQAIEEAVQRHCGERRPFDDVTILIARRLPEGL